MYVYIYNIICIDVYYECFTFYTLNQFTFYSKCNPEMVELLPLNKQEDIAYVKKLLEEFVEKTGSLVAQDLLMLWPEPTTRFVKVIIKYST